MLLLALACSLEQAPPAADAPVELAVFAASSLTDVLPRVAGAWRRKTGHSVVFTFDATSRLARQLESGAEVEIFLSADKEWMDWADERALIRPETRRDLLGNALVVVVPSGSPFVPRSAEALVSPEIAHLALAGEHVPAGRYARAALSSLQVWDAVSARAVYGDTVRTALGWVARGESQAGIVYATDAQVEPGVQLAFPFPADSHPPIVYPGAVTRRARHPAEAAAFLDFCAREGSGIFEEAGFMVLGRDE